MTTPKKRGRAKATIEPELTEAELQEKLGEYTGITQLLECTEVALEEQLTTLRKEAEVKITELKNSQKSLLKTIQKWAERNKKTLFQDKKSREFLFGKIGFRTGKHKLKLLKGFKWADVLEKVKEIAPGYLRIKEETDKARLLSDRDNKNMNELLTQVGIEIIQDESFFIEIKTEETEVGE